MRAFASIKTADKSAAHHFAHSRGSKKNPPFFNSTASSEFPIQRKASCACGGGCPRCRETPAIQAKLTIGQPNDKYEQEADSVADQVMAMPDPKLQRQPDVGEEEEETVQAKPLADQITPLVQRQEEPTDEEEEEEEVPVQAKAMPGQMLDIQRICPDCEEEIAQRQPIEEEEEELQAKSKPGETPYVTPHLESRINSLKGGGQPLDPDTRAFFEPRFGHDFSQVRVHSGSEAAYTAKSIHARAFTLGNHVAMGSGEYHPNSQSGRRLLGHELTHVVQQSLNNVQFASHARTTLVIRRVPSSTPHGRPYRRGIAHNHAPSGRWTDIQALATRRCSGGVSRALEPVLSGRRPTLPSAQQTIDCACAYLPPRQVLRSAYWGRLNGMPLAQLHLDHFISGGGTDYVENVDDFVRRDTNVRHRIERHMRRSRRGHFKVRQSLYAVDDFQFAFGAIDRLDYQHDRRAGVVHIWFADRYEFHPVYPGIYSRNSGDSPRPSNCVHAAAVELTLGTAANYWMYGYARLPDTVFSIRRGSWRGRRP